MITSYIIFALCFFATVHAQTTYYTGGGSNHTWSNSDNWSDGIPTADSIVVINSTGCAGCTIIFDEEEPVVVKELHLIPAVDTDGPVISLTGSLQVDDLLVLGSELTTSSSYDVSIIFRDGELILGEESETHIYYSDVPLYTYYSDEEGHITFAGKVIVKSSAQTGYDYVQIGYGDYPLVIDNWADWDVTDPKLGLRFQYVTEFNHWGGSFWSTWAWEQTPSETPDPNIYFYNTDFNINGVSYETNEDGTEGDAIPVIQGPTAFYSSYSNSFSSYGSDVKKIYFNTTDITLSWIDTTSVQILLENDGVIDNSNITSYTSVNSSTGDYTLWLTGDNKIGDYVQFTAVDSGNLRVVIQPESTLTGFSGSLYTGFFGNVFFVNNGEISDIYWTLYIDETAWVINYGLIELTSKSIYFTKSYFASNPNPSTIGTFVNRGTIQLVSSTVSWSSTGKFLQCEEGVIKLAIGYPTSSSTSSISLSAPELDGYLSIYWGADYTFSYYQYLFSYDESQFEENDDIFIGKLDIIETYEDITNFEVTQTCVDPSTGNVLLYEFDGKLCSDVSSSYENFITDLNEGGDVCEDVPDFEDIEGTCPATEACGYLETDVPSGGGDDKGSAVLQTASLALLVSAVGFLLNQ